jgi:hypothetical protein
MSIVSHWPPEATPTPPITPPEPPEPVSWWLGASPCPAWCTAVHSDADHPVDRWHRSVVHDIDLSLAPPVETILGHRPEFVSLCLMQAWREIEPRVHFSVGEAAATDHQLTLAEARDVFDRVATLLTAAGGESR